MPNIAEVLFGLIVVLGLCIAGLCRSHHVTNQRLDELEADKDEILTELDQLEDNVAELLDQRESTSRGHRILPRRPEAQR